MSSTRADDIIVSVAMVTYNHESFIAEAIEGVLKQQIDFNLELVIGEDCSTDGTRAIVQAYATRFPGKIRLLLAERNRGMMANYTAVLQACRGRYVALLDGDDFWTDPGKLQKQVDFLESRQECAICFHDVAVAYQDQPFGLRRYCSQNQAEISGLADLLRDNFIPACSSMFRRGLFAELPDWFFTLPWVDWTLHILNAQYGDIGYLDQVMGVYRIHANNVSQTQWRRHDLLEARVRMYRHLDAYLAPEYRPLIKQRIAFSYYQMASVDRRQGAKVAALRNLLIAFGLSPTKPPIPYSKAFKKLLQLWPAQTGH